MPMLPTPPELHEIHYRREGAEALAARVQEAIAAIDFEVVVKEPGDPDRAIRRALHGVLGPLGIEVWQVEQGTTEKVADR